MKILFINTSDSIGGAAIACHRLMHALQEQGNEVSMLVLNKKGDDPLVTEIEPSRWGRMRKKYMFLRERLGIFLENGLSRKHLFTVSSASSGFDISRHPLVKEADILHIHWVNQGFLSLEGIHHLFALGKPVVWTMHDLWAATGICHHPRSCVRYRTSCGSCPFLGGGSPRDLAHRVMEKKKLGWNNAGVHFVGCSEWLTAQARESSLAAGNDFSVVPNPIDTALFSPGERLEARKRLKLPADKKLILFGAVIASDKRKGIDFLAHASQLLSDLKEDTELVMFGQLKGGNFPEFGLRIHELGYIGDAALMADVYRAADLFVTPSLEENLPNTIMEAMACGVPCVGFKIGGIPEMITPEETGYLAAYRSAPDLANGIRYVLQHRGEKMSRRCREFVETHYSEQQVAQRYTSIYKQAQEKKKHA